MANKTEDLAGMLSNVTSHAMSITVSIQSVETNATLQLTATKITLFLMNDHFLVRSTCTH